MDTGAIRDLVRTALCSWGDVWVNMFYKDESGTGAAADFSLHYCNLAPFSLKSFSVAGFLSMQKTNHSVVRSSFHDIKRLVSQSNLQLWFCVYKTKNILLYEETKKKCEADRKKK